MSPTQRTLGYLRELGYVAAVVEKWIPGANIRKDLFDCWDVVFVGNGELGMVQVTTASNMGARIKKIADNAVTPELRKANVRLLVHGWRKLKGRWVVKEQDVS